MPKFDQLLLASGRIWVSNKNPALTVTKIIFSFDVIFVKKNRCAQVNKFGHLAYNGGHLGVLRKMLKFLLIFIFTKPEKN